MKRITILLIALFSALLANSQNILLDGDRYFDNGDYVSAETKYNEVFKSANGKDKQFAEIKLTRAKWCVEQLKTANQAFANKNYKTAKEKYQSVLDSNPKDTYAKSQIEMCNKLIIKQEITLSVSKYDVSFSASGGKSESITVYSNASSYSIALVPSWCTVQTNNGYFVVTCSANTGNIVRNGYFNVVAGNKTVRVNVVQSGNNAKQDINLSVSKNEISFSSSGGISESISVFSNANYTVSLVPSWCKVQVYNGYLTVTCTANTSATSRTDWFKVSAGDKSVRIIINQLGTEVNNVNKFDLNKIVKNIDGFVGDNDNLNNISKNSYKSLKYYNKTYSNNYHTGLSISYVSKQWVYKDESSTEKYGFWDGSENINGIQLGIRVNPSSSRGFGISTGLFYEYYYSLSSTLTGQYTDDYSNYYYTAEFSEHSLHLPLELVYKVEFSNNFNLFFYSGFSVDYGLSSTLSATMEGESEPFYTNDDNYDDADYDYPVRFNASFDYGLGIRINRLQFNLETSKGLINLSKSTDYSVKQDKDITIGFSYLF